MLPQQQRKGQASRRLRLLLSSVEAGEAIADQGLSQLIATGADRLGGGLEFVHQIAAATDNDPGLALPIQQGGQ